MDEDESKAEALLLSTWSELLRTGNWRPLEIEFGHVLLTQSVVAKLLGVPTNAAASLSTRLRALDIETITMLLTTARQLRDWRRVGSSTAAGPQPVLLALQTSETILLAIDSLLKRVEHASTPSESREVPFEALVGKLEFFVGRGLSRDEKSLLASPALQFIRDKLANDKFQQRDVPSVLIQLGKKMSTSTKARVTLENEGLSLNGSVTSFGQRGVEILYAFDGPSVLCAKIGARVSREFEISQEIHRERNCPTVLQILSQFTVPAYGGWDGVRQGITMPLYPQNVLQAHIALQADDFSSRERLAFAVTVSGLASIHAFKLGGFAHGDVKPTNMMLSCDRSGIITLIDFGAARRIGESLEESSKHGLNEDTIAHEKYDLVCLGVSLVEILDSSTDINNWLKSDAVAALSQYAARSPSPSPVVSAALACLEGKETSEAIARRLVAQMQEQKRAMLPTFETVWPKDR